MDIDKINYEDYKVTYCIDRNDIGKNTVTLSVTIDDMFIIVIHNMNGDFMVNSTYGFNMALNTYLSTISTLQALILP